MYQIVTDGSCDLYEEIVNELDIQVVPFYVAKDGVHHQKEIQEIGIRELYQYMIENPKVFPKTSMPSIQDYLDVFTPLVKQNIDILCICISPNFSGSFNSAMNAKNILLDEYPNVKIEIIDSTIATCLQGMLVEEAIKNQRNGASFEENVEFVNRIKQTGRIFFTIDSMDYLVHGGRVGKLSGIAAGTLGIKPLIYLEDGEIISHGVTRGRKKAKKLVIEQFIDYLIKNNIDLNNNRICVGFGYDDQEIIEFKNHLIEALSNHYKIDEKDIPIRQIGATIGVHTGPLPIGIGILEKYRK